MKTSGTAARRKSPARITVRGAVRDDDAATARDRIAALVARIHGNVSEATVRLTAEAAGTGRPAMAQMNLTVDGRPFRAKTTAATVREAVGLAAERLLELVSPLERRAAAGAPPSPQRRLDPIWPKVGHTVRKVVRRKPTPLVPQSPDEAADTLERLDYDFHLFIDAESDSDSVIYRGVPSGYLLAQVQPGPPEREPTRIPLTVNALPAPRLALAQARKELAALQVPFLFFADEATGRGTVLYRRHDGDYGLILPTSDPPPGGTP
jgi:hypothetical protein